MAQDGSRTDKDWRNLAEEAAQETDPIKLEQLVEELCAALDEKEKLRKDKPERDSGKVP
jgi:hypothetical protein